jgi:hypothetical protein
MITVIYNIVQEKLGQICPHLPMSPNRHDSFIRRAVTVVVSLLCASIASALPTDGRRSRLLERTPFISVSK